MIERKSGDRKNEEKKITNPELGEKAKLKDEEKTRDEEKRGVSRTDWVQKRLGRIRLSQLTEVPN